MGSEHRQHVYKQTPVNTPHTQQQAGERDRGCPIDSISQRTKARDPAQVPSGPQAAGGESAPQRGVREMTNAELSLGVRPRVSSNVEKVNVTAVPVSVFVWFSQ